MLESFVGAIERCEDPDHRILLERVCDLLRPLDIETSAPGTRSTAASPRPARRRSPRPSTSSAESYVLTPTTWSTLRHPDEVLKAPIGLPGGEASRTSAMKIDDPGKNVRELLGEPAAADA